MHDQGQLKLQYRVQYRYVQYRYKITIQYPQDAAQYVTAIKITKQSIWHDLLDTLKIILIQELHHFDMGTTLQTPYDGGITSKWYNISQHQIDIKNMDSHIKLILFLYHDDVIFISKWWLFLYQWWCYFNIIIMIIDISKWCNLYIILMLLQHHKMLVKGFYIKMM